MALFDFDAQEARPARFAARLPILSAGEKVFGYKLLFRSDVNNYFPSVEGDIASRGVIDMSSLIGLNTLSNNLPAFIVTTRDILVRQYLALLPVDKVIAEIPDSVSSDAEVLHACLQLKKAGCKIALSNFRANDPRRELEEIADFLKVDIKSSSLADVASLTSCYRGRGPRLIAEKVETREDFEFCRAEGFSYFEGFFFRKPEMMRARGAQSNRTVYLRLLSAISRPDLDWKEIEEIVKSDPMLYYRLLRYLNSAIFGLRGEVKSVAQALTILGEKEIRRWCQLSGMLELSRSKPSDLALAALVRARFAELIGARANSGDANLFQVGLLSLMDAILEIPMRDVLEGLPLDDSARTVLLEDAGPLSPVYDLVLAVEAGIWPRIAALASQLNIDQEFVAKSHWTAMEWAQSIVTAA
jgi:EAL and modified HD-GYP domain-containing signal transduction protein